MNDHEFEAEMVRQILAVGRAGDVDQAHRLIDRMLLESTDPAATGTRAQALIRGAA